MGSHPKEKASSGLPTRYTFWSQSIKTSGFQLGPHSRLMDGRMIPVSHPTRRDNLAVVFGSAGRSANHLTDHSSLESLVPSPHRTCQLRGTWQDPSTMGLLQTPRQKASKGDPPIVPCWKPEGVQQAGFLHHRQRLSPRHYDSRNLLTRKRSRSLPLRLAISKDRGRHSPVYPQVCSGKLP